ncbi:MAG: glycosyltransferase family 4 protein [Phycisphaerales bacterium]|nr:glycosyltransferase family 4 protein [Phycisphaerales bacterium]
MINAVICWTDVSGYMASCYRAMAARSDVRLSVIARKVDAQLSHAGFKDDLLRGVDAELLTWDELSDIPRVTNLVASKKPDVIVVCGWAVPSFRALATDPRLASAAKVMGMDTPMLGTLRQRLGGMVRRGFFSRIDRVFVTGERSFQLARTLGFEEARIRRGVYGIDYPALAPLHARRAARPDGWPRRFLYLGRYVPDKAIDVLAAAYEQYRALAPDQPWPLTCCGQGPLADLLRRVPGVDDRGFLQPPQLPDVYVEHGAFVLASRFDPWPLVVVESAAAGLPILCTEACGSAVECVRSFHNGLTVATEDPAALARGMLWMHTNHHRLPDMGAHGRELAAAYSAERWAERWATAFRELLDQRR